MGFSISAVVVIFLASLIYIATVFYPQVDISYNNFFNAQRKSTEMQYDKLNTRIEIASWIDNNVTVYNNGSTSLNASKLNVIFNGTLKNASYFQIYPGGAWSPRTSINVTIPDTSGRVKIIASNGVSDYYNAS